MKACPSNEHVAIATPHLATHAPVRSAGYFRAWRYSVPSILQTSRRSSTWKFFHRSYLFARRTPLDRRAVQRAYIRCTHRVSPSFYSISTHCRVGTHSFTNASAQTSLPTKSPVLESFRIKPLPWTKPHQRPLGVPSHLPSPGKYDPTIPVSSSAYASETSRTRSWRVVWLISSG